MPKFKKSLFISFHGDNPIETQEFFYQNREQRIFHKTHKSSYFEYQKYADDYYGRSGGLFPKVATKIRVATERKRKSLATLEMPLVSINFPYDGRDEYFEEQAWNISQEKTNTQIAEEMIANELIRLKPHSRIYINAHGNQYDSSITQRIYGIEEKFEINYRLLARLLNEYIPYDARYNLQIFMLVCDPSRFSAYLMDELDRYGFIKTSVVCYDRISVSIPSRQFDLENDTAVLLDYGSNYKISGEGSLDGSSDKLVYHNYTGRVENHYYDYFKQEYYRNLAYYDDHTLIEELGLLKSKLLGFTQMYIDRYQQRGDHGIFHQHGESGFNRAIKFQDDLFNRGVYIVDEAIIAVLNIIIDFVQQVDDNYSGSINVNEHSLLTYILTAIDDFYKYQLCQSPIFQEFFYYLTGRRQTEAEPGVYVGIRRSKRVREDFKRLLENLSFEMIYQWYSLSTKVYFEEES